VVGTAQVAPTILKALDLDPNPLYAVRVEGTPVLPNVKLSWELVCTIWSLIMDAPHEASISFTFKRP
jgi:hypothetical protein